MNTHGIKKTIENRFPPNWISRQGWILSGIKERGSRLYFSTVKLPLMLLAIVFGFIFEFVMELPFVMLMLLRYRTGRNH